MITEKFKIGARFKVLEDIYPVDLDKMVSSDIAVEAFTGLLSAIYLEKELLQIKKNIDTILEQKINILKKDSIIEIKYIEFERNEISYVEVYEINIDEFGTELERDLGNNFNAYDCLREEFLEELN